MFLSCVSGQLSVFLGVAWRGRRIVLVGQRCWVAKHTFASQQCGSQGTLSDSLSSLQRSVIGCAASAVQDMRKCVLKQGSGRVWLGTKGQLREWKCWEGRRPSLQQHEAAGWPAVLKGCGVLLRHRVCVLQWPAILCVCRSVRLWCAASGLNQHLACSARRGEKLA
jgi:hypothetical protein